MYEMLKVMYLRREAERQERKQLGKLNLEKVLDIDLENAQISKREYE